MDKEFKNKLASFGALSSAFVLAGSHEAEAQVVYVDLPDTPVEATANTTVASRGSSFLSISIDRFLNLDLENGMVNSGFAVSANADFAFRLDAEVSFARYISYSTFTNNSIFYSYTFTASSSIRAEAFNRLYAGQSNVIGTAFPSNLSTGAMVGPTGSFGPANIRLGRAREDFGGTSGQANFFAGSVPSDITGYLGVRFDLGGNTHYGWLRVRVELDTEIIGGGNYELSANSRMTILDYAYESTPDTAIEVGDTGEPTAPIPTMGQWGLIILNLLLIIFGVRAVRNREKILIKKRV